MPKLRSPDADRHHGDHMVRPRDGWRKPAERAAGDSACSCASARLAQQIRGAPIPNAKPSAAIGPRSRNESIVSSWLR